MADLGNLEQLYNLKEKGIISQEEFEKQKEAILNASSSAAKRKNQIAYCVLALFLGQLGIHNFYVGRWKRGLTQLLLTLLSPLTLFISFFISLLWSIINIFAIHTDGKENEFDPSPTAKWICGILAIIWNLVYIGVIVIGAIAGYTNAMNKYRAEEAIIQAQKIQTVSFNNGLKEFEIDGGLKELENLAQAGKEINEEEVFTTAIYLNQPEKISWLLKHGFDVNKKIKDGWTPLTLACFDAKDSNIVKLLIENGADVNLINDNDESPLISTLFSRNSVIEEIVDILLASGADPHLANHRGYTPLYYAQRNAKFNPILVDNIRLYEKLK